MAVITFAASAITVPALAWCAVSITPASLAFLALTLAASLSTWITEQVLVGRVTAGPSGPKFLVAGFTVTTGVMWVLVLGVAGGFLASFFAAYGTVRLAGGGMEPTIPRGQRLLYEKRVEPERLVRGQLIVWRLSEGTGWGQPGLLTISRILAVPGDRLQIQDGRYTVNDQPGPAVAVLDKHAPRVRVPAAPAELVVPEGRYFIVQDDPNNGFDTQVLSWAERPLIVSTWLYKYPSGPRFFAPVE